MGSSSEDGPLVDENDEEGEDSDNSDSDESDGGNDASIAENEELRNKIFEALGPAAETESGDVRNFLKVAK